MYQDTTRPAKRPRESDAVADSYVHDTTLWLKDGNIILVSSQPQAKGFRVHRSILAMHSEFFADMFNLARPEEPARKEAREWSEDCTTLPLTDGSHDVYCFLQYLYVPNYFQLGTPMSFIQLEAMLRMATKYLCQRLRDDVTKQFDLIYCSKFPSDSPKLPPVPALVPKEDVGTHAITAIRMARLYNIPQILPVAFYYAATIDPVKYVEIHPSLSPEDQLTLIRGRARLVTATFEIAWCWLLQDGFKFGCGDTDCEMTRYSVIRATAPRAAQAVDLLLCDMPHQTVQDQVVPEDDLADVGELCAGCFNHWKTAECAAYSVVWNELPIYFGLTPWPKK
ncbi:hypothetical protein BDZ89DRAFT_963947 [Hymenopellis radicata]|nr:hypothetical protein BDZ89DRAFT_963947 [Hymenopellis radicata]